MIPNPWVILGIVLAWLASLAGVGYWQHHAGTVAERAAWQGKQIDELATANKRIKTLEDAARATEANHAAALAVIGANYETTLQDAEAQRRRDVAAARDGALKLRVTGICPVRPDGGATGQAPAAAGQRDDPTTGELPAAVTADLLELVNDADAAVRQLTACQAVVASDRSP